MPTTPGPALRKVTLNLFDDDVTRLEQVYGFGWSSVVRELVHDHTFRMHEIHARPRTLGDLENER